MDPAKRAEISSKAGKASWEKGTAHKFNPEEARAAGAKGGAAKRRKHAGQTAAE